MWSYFVSASRPSLVRDEWFSQSCVVGGGLHSNTRLVLRMPAAASLETCHRALVKNENNLE